MASIDDDRPSSTTQIERLTEKNYRSWAAIMRAVLDEKELFDVVDGIDKPPTELKDDASEEDRVAYDTALKAY